MIIITEASDTLCVKNPMTGETYEEYQGKQLSDYAFLSFSRIGAYWAWVVHEFDTGIKDGEVSPNSGHDFTVNPDGFIYNDEIYKIQIDILQVEK